jgi:cytoskeletal protein RodZ
MNNERSGRNPTDWMGIAAVIALIIIWQLLELIKAVIIVGVVFALGWGSYWIWSKIQAQKNQQRYLNNFYDNLHHGNTNQSGNYPNNQLNQNQNYQLPPNQSYQNPSSDPNFKDFQEYQKFREWQRYSQQANSNNNNQQNYNPYSDSYEG